MAKKQDNTLLLVGLGIAAFLLLRPRQFQGGTYTTDQGTTANIPPEPPKDSKEWVQWVQLVLSILGPIIRDAIEKGRTEEVAELFRPGGPFAGTNFSAVWLAQSKGVNYYTDIRGQFPAGTQFPQYYGGGGIPPVWEGG